MHPWVGLLLVAGVALAAQGAWALPPIITVKNLRARAGPAYRWKVSNRVVTPFAGPIYPSQSGTARVAVDVERTSITKNFVVSGKLLITNPLQNQQPMEVTGLKAKFSPLVPLLSPLPQQLDCPVGVLQPGQSLSCNFRLELPSGVVNTFTPQVLLAGMPQLEGQPLNLSWPSDEDRQLPTGKVVDEESSCALIQTQVQGGELQRLVQVSAAEEQQDILGAGLEVCDEKASLEYTVTVGPFDESSGLCGLYTIKDISTVRLAAGSIGSSSTSPASLAVTFGGCRAKDVLGGRKPGVAITKLTLGKLVTHEWAAEPISSTNTSSPATVKYNAEHAVDVTVRVQRTVGKEELLLMGEVSITNTEKLPYILPAAGVRIALSKSSPASPEQQYTYISASCPLVGNNIVVPPQVGDKPGVLVCQFKSTVEEAWKKGSIQAQLQTLLSASFEVDSGAPKAYDFDDKARVQQMMQGECVSLHTMRVTNPVDLQSANKNPAVASLAQVMGGDSFKLLPMGTVAGGRMPPLAGDSSAAPMIVCGNETLAWRETYGPFTEYDCGPNMALMGLSARPLSGSGGAISATLAYPMAVKSCTIAPKIVSTGMHAYATDTYKWTVRQTRHPEGDIKIPRQKVESVGYHVRYQRSASVGGFKVAGLFKVINPHQATLNIDEVSYSISRPSGGPITGEADCSGTFDEAYDVFSGASSSKVGAKTNPLLLPQAAPQPGDGGGISPSGAAISGGADAAKPAKSLKLAKKIKMAAAKNVKQVQHASVATAAGAPQFGGDFAEAEVQYEEGGHGPLYCSFEAQLPDDYPSQVRLTVVTDEGAKVTESLGAIDWKQAQKSHGNKCALASFAFASGYASLLQPSSIDGSAPPALAVQICESKDYHFTAKFGPWPASGACGPREARSTATLSLPYSATVIDATDTLSLDVIGCQEPLPTLSVDASQHPVKGSFEWSIVRRMRPVKPSHRHPDPVVTVAGPGSSCPAPALLTLLAKQNKGPHAGGYAKFNQTIVVKRNKPAYDSNKQLFEVKGEVTVLNNADKPLHLQCVEVKITCEGGDQGEHKPVVVKATCPESLYGADYAAIAASSTAGGHQEYLTIPSAAYGTKPVKCKFGAVVPGPGKVAVHAAAVMCDDRRAKAKHTVHLELRQDFFKPSTLGSCIRLRETQQVRDSVTGKADYEILSSGGIPQGGIEVCKSRAWSSVIRVGPLDAYAGEDCQGVTFRSMVVGAPSSGYQERLKSEGVVDVHTKNCQRDYDNSSDDSEEDEADGKDEHEQQPKDSYKDDKHHNKHSGKHSKDKDGSHKAGGHKHGSDSPTGKHHHQHSKKQKQEYTTKDGYSKDSKDGSSDKDSSKDGYDNSSSNDKDSYDNSPGSSEDGYQALDGDSGEGDDSTDDGGEGNYAYEPEQRYTNVMPPLPGSGYTPPQPGYGSSNPGNKLPPLPGAGGNSNNGDSWYADNSDSYDSNNQYAGSGPAVPSLPGYPPPKQYTGSSLPGGVPAVDQGTGSSSSSSSSNAGTPGPVVQQPQPGAAAGDGLNIGSGSSGFVEFPEDDSDGEGSGEGYDDNQSVDFWKGTSKSKVGYGYPGFGSVPGEKLVTSSLQPKASQQHSPAWVLPDRGPEPRASGLVPASRVESKAAAAIAAVPQQQPPAKELPPTQQPVAQVVQGAPAKAAQAPSKPA